MSLMRIMTLGITAAVVCSCATAPTNCESLPGFAAGEEEQLQENRLHCAYEKNSQPELTVFLDAWVEESSPISPEELAELPEAIRHAYAIFENFYNPKALDRIGNPEWGADQFAHARYFIAQSAIAVSVTDKLPDAPDFSYDDPTLSRWDIDDFRPRATSEVPLCLLSERYATLIERFLGSKELPPGHNGIMSTSEAEGESLLRKTFMNQQLQIYHGHWSGWNLITGPDVGQIVFNSDLSRAMVYFSLVYEGGEALYERDGEKWVLVQSRLTWIT